MGLCKDCKHWQAQTTKHPSEIVLDDTKYPHHGFCGKAETYESNPLQGESLALASDTDCFKAYLLTAPSFGCVQFEEKEVV